MYTSLKEGPLAKNISLVPTTLCTCMNNDLCASLALALSCHYRRQQSSESNTDFVDADESKHKVYFNCKVVKQSLLCRFTQGHTATRYNLHVYSRMHMRTVLSLVPRPLLHFNVAGSKKIWEWPGDKATEHLYMYMYKIDLLASCANF